MYVTMIREIIETDHSGEHSVKVHQVTGAEIEFKTPDAKEPKIENPGYKTVGEWKVIKP